jgi:hypothetical protein
MKSTLMNAWSLYGRPAVLPTVYEDRRASANRAGDDAFRAWSAFYGDTAESCTLEASAFLPLRFLQGRLEYLNDPAKGLLGKIEEL